MPQKWHRSSWSCPRPPSMSCPSPTSDLAWSPSPSKQRLPALSPHLSLPSPHRRGSFDGSPQRRRDAALELELGAPDGQGGRIGERLSLGSDDSGSPVRRKKHHRRKKHRHSRVPSIRQSRKVSWKALPCGGRAGGRRKIDKKNRRKHKGRKQYARLDEYAQQQEAAAGPAPSLVKSRPETPADVAPEEKGTARARMSSRWKNDGIQGVPSLSNPLYLRITMADGVLARTGAEVARMAVYPINKHCIVRCIKRVTP